MNLNSFIISTLAPTGVPVRWLNYSGALTTYITFFEYNQQGDLFGDDTELNTRKSIQVDVWDKGDYTELVNQVRTLLINSGFTRNSETEFYEKDTGVYHKVFRLYYTN